MNRPRWHDVLLVSAIIGLAAVGIWSMWADEVRSALHLAPPAAGGSNSPANVPSVATGST